MKRKTLPREGWWFSDASGVLPHGDGRAVIIGKKLSVKGKLEICVNALHGSFDPFDALYHARGDILHRVLFEGCRIEEKDKLGSRSRTILDTRDASAMLRHFARRQALSVLGNWQTEMPAVVRHWLETGDPAARSAAWSAAWSAAKSAWSAEALSEAKSAGHSAAESAAWSAADSADRSAADSARSATWSAARSAAWSAEAWSAADSAARSAAYSARSAAKNEAWSAAKNAAKNAEAWCAAECAAKSAAHSAAKNEARIMFNEMVTELFLPQ